jgi:nucleoside-diphosphate-sugar epimerase
MATRRNIASTVWDREFSIEKARRDLEYDPQVSFREGIAETVRWFKSIK